MGRQTDKTIFPIRGTKRRMLAAFSDNIQPQSTEWWLLTLLSLGVLIVPHGAARVPGGFLGLAVSNTYM